MIHYFLDSSALGKRYHIENGTANVDALLLKADAEHFISRLTIVEIYSVFGKVRNRVLVEQDFHLLRRQFLQDIARRVFRVMRITDFHYQEAERLLRAHGMTRSLRTLDALQLSVALDLYRRGRLEYFVCADTRLCHVAQKEGLAILNPEDP